LPFLVAGTIVGSVVIKLWKLKKVGITLLAFIALIGGGVCLGILIFVGCDSIDMAGITVPYPEE